MRRVLAVLVLLTVASRAEATDRIYHDLLDADVEAKRAVVMQKVLPLTGENAVEFQKILKDYQEERGRLNTLRNELVQEYAAVDATMSDQIGEAMVKQYLDLEEKELEIRRKAIEAIQQKLGGRAASQFYLADTKLDLLAYVQILARLPFVK
jgi:hypothetical protein